MAREILVGVTLQFNDTDPDNFAVIERTIPERLRNEGDTCATTIVLPRALCARIAARFNWMKAKENDREFVAWLNDEAGISVYATRDEQYEPSLAVDTDNDPHDHEVTRMSDEGCPH